jgi:CMP-N-acetylneuraminic acid synthetase/spore coat polysaccharide biosynthesis predicted glycosyltransferase SpsG
MNILVVIPARGGSVGIPRKNLRPLNGKPLLYYSISIAKKSKFKPDIFVTSDDSEILMFAERYGAQVHQRNKDLADSTTTLDPVIYNAFLNIIVKNKKKYDFVITIQPTSPLLSEKTLDEAIERIINQPTIDVIISAKEEKHLSWKLIEDKYVPNYQKRLNRQFLDPNFTETGAFVICRAENLIRNQERIHGKVEIANVPKWESVDIDDYDDWAICEFYLRRKKVLINVIGNSEVGLGHVYRGLLIAHEIIDHEIVFLVDVNSQLGYEKIKENNFHVFIQKGENIIDDIIGLSPDLVINDVLDTNERFIKKLKKLGLKVVNFEDLGKGALYADVVINALYPESKTLANHYFGPKYFCAREEFINSKTKTIGKVKKVLLSFGGTDSNNLTIMVLDSIYNFCNEHKIQISVILGLGYKDESKFESYQGIEIFKNIKNISDFFVSSDLIFTSAGRTVYEIACIGTPTIILAQNERELTHLFGTYRNGFVNMKLGKNLSKEQILKQFIKLVNNKEERLKLNKRMLSVDLKNGRQRTIELIKKQLDNK